MRRVGRARGGRRPTKNSRELIPPVETHTQSRRFTSLLIVVKPAVQPVIKTILEALPVLHGALKGIIQTAVGAARTLLEALTIQVDLIVRPVQTSEAAATSTRRQAAARVSIIQ